MASARWSYDVTAAKTVILDNGAGYVKYGNCNDNNPSKMLNCMGKIHKQMNILVGDQLNECFNGSLLNYTRPFDRGYLNNMACEIEVWTRIFGKDHLNIVPSDATLVVTESPLNPESLQNDLNEVIFEDFNFKNCVRKPACWFSAYEFSQTMESLTPDFSSASTLPLFNTPKTPNCCTIIDSGFSFTHIFPIIDMKICKNSIKRINIGGKLLTNHLKEVVSYRQWNMMDEFALIDQVKEALCYVTLDMDGELKESQYNKLKGVNAVTNADGTRRIAMDPFSGNMRKLFVLPDYHTVYKGFVKPDGEMELGNEQVLQMETERFSVPEVLFRPSDIGINQAGIAEATWQSLHTLPNADIALASRYIILTGGNVKLPQFGSRYNHELRPYLPDMFESHVYIPQNPDEYAWRGASRFIRTEINNIQDHIVSKQEYLECGNDYCNRKFTNSVNIV